MLLPASTERRKVIVLNIDLIRYNNAITSIIALGRAKQAGYACFVNAHMAIEAYKKKTFSQAVNAATFLFADGMPIVKVLRLFYGVKQDRIAGMDFMPSIIKACAENELSVFLFGSTPDVLSAIESRLRILYPAFKIAGRISPSFNEFSEEEAESYVKQINGSNANLVLVGMGCPKQETWMAKYSERINAPLLGVGGAFAVFAGLKRRAPKWMQKLSLEWLYRLIQEPKRMWKRYLFTNTLFIFLIIKEWLQGRAKDRSI
ncbi:WecB/TagA/CpsF family glycosyltransferase [Chryseosolibacter indicus]|uniref:WecB/TagA/CpsF family glycosyltransferase n=1 Tax=Chryseosolibacter indicus TaxID=2782351 RepID=A0ABS5VUR5_9BACT|nr:WecB/TagA/CpsF family glycosyltransferase [Chryseosolibacter indicus]MBT1704570.1 WecB/TagA/CpsF family glycosyltransferase [Chryseosolibacter indicus]